jgi:biotin carboxyl carrier protein
MPRQQFIGAHGSEERSIEIEKRHGCEYTVTIDGVSYEVDARQFEAGTWNLIIDGQSYDVELEVAGDNESEGFYNALVRGNIVNLNVQDERRRRASMLGSGLVKVEGPQVLAAPMPGKIVKILVEVGAEVEDGQGLVVVEAMKMENELRAPTNGTVTSIFVEEGQAVEARAKLLALE